MKFDWKLGWQLDRRKLWQRTPAERAERTIYTLEILMASIPLVVSILMILRGLGVISLC